MTKKKNKNIISKIENKLNFKKNKSSKVNHKVKSKPANKTDLHNTIGKIIVIIMILGGIIYTNQSFSNSISLLGVNENKQGIIVSGSTINLSLEIKPGTGKVFSNLNTLEEIDTQISIINSQKISCDIFELNCNKYDFFYTFDGNAVVLKGPSASSAIGIITAKTVNKEKIDKSTVITGSLNSGGIIGNVGGVDKKIEVAKNFGFKKILIPNFSKYNKTKNYSITVIPVLNLVGAYNQFNGKKFIPQKKEIDYTNYNKLMKNLTDMMCARTIMLENTINKSSIEINSTLDKNLLQAKKSYNSSLNAYNNSDYYSSGSFCYNANINYRLILEEQKKINITQRDVLNKKLKNKIEQKYVNISSTTYKSQLSTVNDFYVYMILLDRIEEAKKFLKDDLKQLKKESENKYIENISNNNTNIINNNSTKQNISTTMNYENSTQIVEEEKVLRQNMQSQYSFATERLFTVTLWEQFISHTGNKIYFTQSTINEACNKINHENRIKSQLLEQYNLAIFSEEMNEINKLATLPFENKYLCIYKGLELNGKMNTIINSVGIENGREKQYINQIQEITENRLAIQSDGNFPIIPYIYSEYSRNLANEGNYQTAALYSNFALTYADIGLYIETSQNNKYNFFDIIIKELFEFQKLSLLFILSLLVILGFS